MSNAYVEPRVVAQALLDILKNQLTMSELLFKQQAPPEHLARVVALANGEPDPFEIDKSYRFDVIYGIKTVKVKRLPMFVPNDA